MSAKISALTAATNISNTDVVAGLRSGANVKITRPIFLDGSGGDIALNGTDLSQIGIDAVGDISILSPNHGIVISANSGSALIAISSAGDITIDSSPGGTVNLTQGSGTGIVINAAGDMVIVNGGVAEPFFPYPRGTVDWASDPTDVLSALDRIANALAGVLGFPIP